MLVQISDDAGVRNLAYNSFNELETEEHCKLSCFVHPCLWLITWDPTQPVATRPLAIQKDGTWYTYGWDLTKNICEIFGPSGYIRSTYAYTPFGSVTANGDVTQPIQWSSECYENELALVYYNYRHYNPTDGRWINRDPIAEQGAWNLYGFVGNKSYAIEYIGHQEILPILPGEATFLKRYGNVVRKGNGEKGVVPTMGYIPESAFQKFYNLLERLKNKKINNKKCYYVGMFHERPAKIDDIKLNANKRNIIYIIGHAVKKNGENYIKLKDGYICINSFQEKGLDVKGFGCYIGEYKREISHEYALYELMAEINNLLTNHLCPCKRLLIYSGPVMQ